jgi:uncharacterized protein YoxC
MELNDVIKILSIVSLVVFVILAFYLIAILKTLITKLSKTFDEVNFSLKSIRDDLSDLKVKTIESMKAIDVLADQVADTTKNIDDRLRGIDRIIEPFEYLSQTVYHRIAPSINQASAVVAASGKAISVFIKTLFGAK